MTKNELIQSINSLCEKLRNRLPEEEYKNGWSKTKQLDVLKYFEEVEKDISNRNPIKYISFVRTLDSIGISDGELFEEACGITNEINSKYINI